MESELLVELDNLLQSGSRAVTAPSTAQRDLWIELVNSELKQSDLDAAAVACTPQTTLMKQRRLAAPRGPQADTVTQMADSGATNQARTNQAGATYVRNFCSRLVPGRLGMGLSVSRHGSRFTVNKLNDLSQLGEMHPARAAQPPLMEGDVLLAINGTVCQSSAELAAAVKAEGPVLQLQVERHEQWHEGLNSVACAADTDAFVPVYVVDSQSEIGQLGHVGKQYHRSIDKFIHRSSQQVSKTAMAHHRCGPLTLSAPHPTLTICLPTSLSHCLLPTPLSLSASLPLFLTVCLPTPLSLSASLPLSSHLCCYDEIKGIQDPKIYSHADSLILSSHLPP